MNVAQVNQSVDVVSNKGKPKQIDRKSFSEEFEKYYNSSAKKDLATDDSESERLNNELQELEEIQQEIEFVTFSLINPFLKLDAEVNDLNQTLEEESLTSLTNGTYISIESISQQLTADTTNDLSSEEQTFILHNEPSDNESNLFAKNQSDMSEMQGKQTSDESLDDTKPLTEVVPQIQTEIGTAVSEFTQTLDANLHSTLVKEISEMMESTEFNEATKSNELELSPAIKEILKMGKFEPIDPETLQKIVTSLKVALNTEQETDQKSANRLEIEEIMRSAVKGAFSLKQLNEERGETHKTLNQTPVNTPHKDESAQTVDMNRSTELQMTDVESEVTENLVSVHTVKKEMTQADTDYDFVSMLRQMSNQSSKESSQIVAKSNTEASVPVPKEQSVNLVQDMVASFAENREGLKTYKTTLHLSPETLGKVTIELSLNEEGLSGKLTFQSDETRKWMEGEWLDLKLPLESKGLTIKAFDFTTSQPATQQQGNFSFSENPSQSEQDSQKQSLSEDHDLTLAENDEQMPETRSTNKDGINVYV
ncbi:flagellar hook-length control protein FliK [Alkalibacterium sp. f15]|uniref:flagellar hook-length control protein FliK n=1 Tax=Alkalibacterium sp. f15 TaxID=3414029 RepID=UPI003BF82854